MVLSPADVKFSPGTLTMPTHAACTLWWMTTDIIAFVNEMPSTAWPGECFFVITHSKVDADYVICLARGKLCEINRNSIVGV